MSKNNIIVIPARGGSIGIPDKNIKIFNGKPLIAHTIELSKKVETVNKIIVSTDSNSIKSIATKFGAETPFKRPDNLSGPDISVDEVLSHANSEMINLGYQADCIILLFVTNPLRNLDQINKCIEMFYKSKADCVFTVNESPAHYTPYWTLIEDKDNNFTYFDGNSLYDGIKRRQDFPEKCYAKNDLVFAINPRNFTNFNSLFGKKNKVLVTEPIYDCDINKIEDWAVCEERFKSLYLK